jgi:hypothetical protein
MSAVTGVPLAQEFILQSIELIGPTTSSQKRAEDDDKSLR